MNTEDALSGLRKKLPLVGRSVPKDTSASQKTDTAIQNALGIWRGNALNGMHKVLDIPVDTTFTHGELDLAGWTHEYAVQANLPFKLALEQIFEYLKRNPKSLENYTNGDANFAESAEGVGGCSFPFGWNVDPQVMKTFRHARIYQAGYPDCDLVHAVIAVVR